MKKLLFITATSVTFLSGCTTAELVELNGDNCFKVFQTLPDGALVHRCTSVIGSSNPICTGVVAYIPNSSDSQLYDEKLVCMKKAKMTRLYTYTTVKDRVKTVPVFEESGGGEGDEP